MYKRLLLMEIQINIKSKMKNLIRSNLKNLLLIKIR